MKRILLVGKNGQIGWELQRTLMTLGEIVAVDRETMDLCDPDAIRHVIREYKPDVIVNAAGYTAVDRAESDAAVAMQVNGTAPGVMAEEAKRLGVAMVHYSTDYVFDGTKSSPYTEEDEARPLNVYGRSKLAGEQAIQAVGATHLILRTSWIYGARGNNFLLGILRVGREGKQLRIVEDQNGAPTWSRVVAEATAQILAQCYSLALARGADRSGLSAASASCSFAEGMGGIYHVVAEGRTSWYGFAKAIFNRISAAEGATRATLTPVTSEQYATPAKRPKNSALSTEKLRTKFGLEPGRWEDGLDLCLHELRSEAVARRIAANGN